MEKEKVVKRFFENWIKIFGNPGEVLVDNGGEFCNIEFVKFCENLNI